jgi:putative oxidoreductase
MFESVAGRPPSRLRMTLRKLPTIQQTGVAVLFVLIGWSKFDSDPRHMWVQIFDRIGFGQWLRFVTGMMQVAGAVLLLVPKTMTAGAAMLACTMLGATFVDAVLLQEPAFVVTLLLFVVIAVTWATSRP